MKIFLDTSSLFKLYYREADTHIIEGIFQSNTISHVFLSEITKIEFESTVWKKLRVGDISTVDAASIIANFAADATKYTFLAFDSLTTTLAKQLMAKYGQQGLRTLDCIQLSVAVSLINVADLFVTSDRLMQSFFIQESLPV